MFAAVAAHPGIRLSELFEIVAAEANRDDIFAMIASEIIFADLHSVPLVDVDRVVLSTKAQRGVAATTS